MDNFAIDEYIYMLNGKARVQPEGGEDLFFRSGEHFFAAKGYTGEWEIMVGENYPYELSVITTPRADSVIKSKPLLPTRLDPDALSGLDVGLQKKDTYQSTLVKGDELTISLFAERPQVRDIITPAK
ncbi:MAG: cupin domain-containing protein [Bacteroidota bacterium]